MSAAETSGETESDVGSGELPLGATLLSGAVAAAAAFPLTWIVLRAADVELERAVALLARPRTAEIMLNSLLLVALVTAISVALAVPLAFLTTRTDLPFRRFWTVAVSLPLVVPSYIGAFAFVSAFGPRGELQSLLAPLGVERLPQIYGLPGTVLVVTLYTYPYVFITTRAALKSFDTTLVDAARTLNHGRWETFRRVTLPQIRPAIAAGALLTALYAVSDFGTPAIMRLNVFTRVIYVEYNAWGYDYAALLSLQLIAVTAVILAVESRLSGDDTLYTTTKGTSGTSVVRLGRWRWPAIACCALVVVAALALPIGILCLWLFRGTAGDVPSLSFEWEYALNSVYVAGIAAIVAALGALPVGYLSARYPSRLTRLFERTTYVGYAVPGIVLGLALVYFGANYAAPLYQTIPLLVFAYVVRFLPQAVGSTRTSILQVNPRLAEATRSLGYSPFESFRRVTLPLIAPGVLGGAALVFLTTMKELPATLILRPTGFETLVTHIWRAQEAAYYGYAAVPALILVFVSGLSMLVILSRENGGLD